MFRSCEAPQLIFVINYDAAQTPIENILIIMLMIGGGVAA
jgi:hypothetical protein